MTILFIAIAFLLGLAATYLCQRLSKYTGFTLYELTDDMLPVERELLEEIVAEPQYEPGYQRMRLRLNLDAIQVRLRRILMNASRPKYWARNDLRTIRKDRWEHAPEVLGGIDEVLEAERELRWLTRRELFRIWLWSLSGFQKRDWGPVPNLRKFRVQEILEAYDRLKAATISLARLNGEAAVAEDIAAVM